MHQKQSLGSKDEACLAAYLQCSEHAFRLMLHHRLQVPFLQYGSDHHCLKSLMVPIDETNRQPFYPLRHFQTRLRP